MSTLPSSSPRPARRTRLLVWIIAFKAAKSILLTTLAIALLTTRHSDPVALLMRLALTIHLPASSRLLDRAITALSTLTVSQQTTLAVTAFAYAVLMAAEGIALSLRKPWARWFTVVASSSLVPVEIYEIVREVHPMRVVVLVINVAIVVYLWRRKEIFDG
jgi:uncharacterized membrane protein (DUF2068 family)